MFENIGKKITETGSAIGGKAKQVSEVTHLSYKATVAEKEKEAMFTVLGKTVYEAAKNDSQSPYFEDCEKITAKQEELEDLKTKIDNLKGLIICPKCGEACDSKNDYCGKCGAKLPKPVPNPPAAAENTDDSMNENKDE